MNLFSVRSVTRKKKNISRNKVIKTTKICGRTAKVYKGKNGQKAIYKLDDNEYVVRDYPLTLVESIAPCGGLKSSCGPKCQKRRKQQKQQMLQKTMKTKTK